MILVYNSQMTKQEEIEKLEQAIAALEAQRQNVGDAIIEAALAPIQEKLATLRAAPKSESRKLVTVLFADLVDHTALFARLDPEDVQELLEAYFGVWKTCITGHGGIVEKFIGDAVMAVFGEPSAREDDPEQAIWAALEMRKKLEELNKTFEQNRGIRLAMRVGITTGEVVSSARGERQGEEFVVVGTTVNLASRLQASAPEGGILISHDTYRHVRGIFNVTKLDPIEVKGMEELAQVYLILGAKQRAFRMATRGVEGIETRMVGREGHLKRLQDAFHEVVEEGERQVITITGEAGIGKSRLIYEFDNWLEFLPQTIYYFKGRAYTAAQNSPYSLVRSVFAFRFQILSSESPDELWEKLNQGLRKVLGENESGSRKAYFISRLLGFELGEGLPWKEYLEDAGKFHEQALIYLGQFFHTLAQENPVVVLLEDIHWADDSSLDLIHHLESFQAKQPLLIVCTARNSLFARRPNWAESIPFHQRLNLESLTKHESRQLVEEILQKMGSVPEELRELVTGRADGNPFYIEEGIKMLVEEGAIEKSPEAWRVNLDQLREIRIPETLVGLLQARLDALDPKQRALLQRSAVIGRVFWDKAVMYLGTQVDKEQDISLPDTQELLGELRTREIIFWRELSSFEDTQEYLFKHSLLRDVSYESLLKRHRRAYHAHAARWLEQMTQRSQRTDEYASLIALHYEQAGEHELAGAWYQRSGKQAAANFANAEAVYAFTKALELTPESDPLQRFEILSAREKILHLQGARQRQQIDLKALVQLSEMIGDDVYRSKAALRQANFALSTGDYPAAAAAAQNTIALAQRANLISTEAEGYYTWGRSIDFQFGGTEALEKFEQALKLARAAQLYRLEADVLMSLGPHYSDLSEYEQARKHLSAALQIYRQLDDTYGEGRALGNLGVTYWGQGNYTEAKFHFEAALQVIRKTGYRRGEGIVLGNLGVIAREQLNYAESQHFHEQALEISREILDRFSEFIHLGNLGEALRDQGDFNSAKVLYEEALKIALEVGSLHGQSAILNSWSLLMEYLGDSQTALDNAQQALIRARGGNSVLFESASLSRLGQALFSVGRHEEASEHFRMALDLLRKLGLENRAIEALAGLARVSLARGEVSVALDHVEQVLQHLDSHNLLGTEEPVAVYLTCYQVLRASGDPRAAGILETGYQFLQERAVLIGNQALRRSFLEKVPMNRQLNQLWREASNRPG
jgi:predicted ATPase/class 3 adenylate cyclase